MLSLIAPILSSVFIVPAFDQVGPCHPSACPTVDITVCHNPKTGNSSATVRNYSSSPPSVRHVGLGMGSTKVIHVGGVAFFPCGKLTWSDVMDCEDIWYEC